MNMNPNPSFTPRAVRYTHRASGGFTLIEILIGIAIICVLAAMLIPSLQSARECAKGAVCLSNLRQFGVALDLYVADFNGVVPTASPRCPSAYCPGSPVADERSATWLGTVYDLGYCRDKKAMKCPADPVRRMGLLHADYSFDNSSYGYNFFAFRTYWTDPFVRLSEVRNPSLTYLAAYNSDNAMFPGNYFFSNCNALDPEFMVSRRHRQGANILWVDGHSSWLPWQEVLRHHFCGDVAYGGNPEKWWDVDFDALGY